MDALKPLDEMTIDDFEAEMRGYLGDAFGELVEIMDIPLTLDRLTHEVGRASRGAHKRPAVPAAHRAAIEARRHPVPFRSASR